MVPLAYVIGTWGLAKLVLLLIILGQQVDAPPYEAIRERYNKAHQAGELDQIPKDCNECWVLLQLFGRANKDAELAKVARLKIQVFCQGESEPHLDSIRVAGELRLRELGVALTGEANVDPVLFVEAHAHCDEISGACAYVVECSLVEPCYPERTIRNGRPKWVVCETWNSGPGFGTTAKGELNSKICDMVRQVVDRFANAYLKANPK